LILEAVREAGAQHAGYVLLRLPHEVAGMFDDWLRAHYPNQADRVLNRIRDCRDGRLYDNRFGKRMRGEGVFADLISRRFRLAVDKLDFPGMPELRCDRFRSPAPVQPQMDLFDLL